MKVYNFNEQTLVGDLVQVETMGPDGTMRIHDGVICGRFPHGDPKKEPRYRIKFANGSSLLLRREDLTNHIGR